MGATSSVVTHKLDLRKKDLSYDTFEQHMAIVGDKSLARLRELRLCRNKLSALPPRVQVMAALVDLRVTDNWLKYLPDATRDMTNLESLRVGGNQLVSIDQIMPPEIRAAKTQLTEEGGPQEKYTKLGPYKTLRTLRFGQNRVSRLPLNFARLFVNLRTLVANKNGIAVLPVDIWDLPLLEVLVLSKNELMTLPPVNNTKIRLRCLVLSKNKFEEVPQSVGRIKLLQKLYLDNNRIENLPKALGALKYMYKLDMSMNKLTGDVVLHSGLLKSATLTQVCLLAAVLFDVASHSYSSFVPCS